MLRLISVALLLVVCGCNSTTVTMTERELSPLQERAISSHEIGNQFDATYSDVWWATITALQDQGFLLRQANKDAGFIYGVWSNTHEKKHNIEVSVTLEALTERTTRARISARIGAGGEPQNDAAFATRLFAAVHKEVFLRTVNKQTTTANSEPRP